MCRFFMKTVLFVINFITTLSGIALVAGGALLILALNLNIDSQELQEVLKYADLSVVRTIGYTVIVIGAIIFFISFCGCCGACFESKCMLITYACCVAVLAAIKIYIIVQIFCNLNTYKGEIEGIVDKLFEQPIDLNQTSSVTTNVNANGGITEIINNGSISNQYNATVGNVLELALHCCGTTGPGYYNTTITLPPTCCANSTSSVINLPHIIPETSNLYAQNTNVYVQNTNLYAQNLTEVLEQYQCLRVNAYQTGCSTLVGDYFGKYAILVGYGVIIVFVLELVEILFAVLLCTTCCKATSK